MERPSLLLVEDEPNLSKGIVECLEAEGFSVKPVRTLAAGRTTLASQSFALLLLDWMLPDGQGIDLLKEFRAVNNITPVVMLTARSQVIDKVLGLEMGAQDYVTKPFEPRELVARIRALLRWSESQRVSPEKSQSNEKAERTLAGICIRFENRQAWYQGQPLELTKMEYDLLVLLFDHPNRVFSRDELLDKVWGYDSYPTTRTVDNHILQLRQKTHPDLFETVRGVGYRFFVTGD